MQKLWGRFPVSTPHWIDHCLNFHLRDFEVCRTPSFAGNRLESIPRVNIVLELRPIAWAAVVVS